MTRAAVFAYHNVGVRCLDVLHAGGVEVSLLITHEDDSNEEIWFESVAARARAYGVPVIAPQDPNAPDIVQCVRSSAPDILFSFYYRRMLCPGLLALPFRGAYNVHGSLLPKYRGRSPVNWAILKGEQETGATLHEMVAKPDAGRIVDQERVPIGPNDIAREVFDRVTAAAATVLERSLPALLNGTVRLVPQNLAAGSYFGGRRPEDGAIDPAWPARRVHDLVRAVAPPYPGAFCFMAGKKLRVLRTFYSGERGAVGGRPALLARGTDLHLRCGDGGTLRVLAAELDGLSFSADTMRRSLGAESIPLQAKMAAA
jgi:methionyl-tRNA formyltransferase